MAAAWNFSLVPVCRPEMYPETPNDGEMASITQLSWEISRAVLERCMATYNANNPVSPPAYTATFLNWRMDRQTLCATDGVIKNLVPCYRDQNTGVALTVTGLWSKLQIGDCAGNFTRDSGERISTADLNERLTVLRNLRYITTSKDMVSNDTIFVKVDYPSVTPQAIWEPEEGSGGSCSYNMLPPKNPWNTIKRDVRNRWSAGVCAYFPVLNSAQEPDTEAYEPLMLSANVPHSYHSCGWEQTYRWSTNLYWNDEEWVEEGWLMEWLYGNCGSAARSRVKVGPFDTNFTHTVLVRARSVAYNAEWSSQGAIGSQDQWVEILSVEGGQEEYEFSAVYGSSAICQFSTTPFQAKGNYTEWEAEFSHDIPEWWVNYLNPKGKTNQFGTKHRFQYCL